MIKLWGFFKGILIQDETDRTKQLSVEINPSATTNTRTTLQATQTADRTVDLPDASDTLVGRATTDTLTNKTIDADNNTISNLAHGAEVDNPTSGVHGVTGNVVGTSDAQTLTNKTIAAGSNTISGLTHGSEVDNPTSGVHGVTGNIVGTSDIQTLTNKTLDFTSATGTNTISADSNDISYDNGTSGLTATNVKAAIDEVAGATGGANTSLSNLSTTSINESLVPNSNALNLGDNTFSWNEVRGVDLYVGKNLVGAGRVRFFNASGTSKGSLYADQTSPSGVSGVLCLIDDPTVSGSTIGLMSQNNAVFDSGDVLIETGNATGGSNNSGDISIRTGTSSGGTRGKVRLQDGTEGTADYALMSTDANGTVEWKEIRNKYQKKTFANAVDGSTTSTTFSSLTNGKLYRINFGAIAYLRDSTNGFAIVRLKIAGSVVAQIGLGSSGSITESDEISAGSATHTFTYSSPDTIEIEAITNGVGDQVDSPFAEIEELNNTVSTTDFT